MWQPIMSPPYVTSCLAVVGAVFIAIGAVIFVASDAVDLVTIQYDQEQSCPFSERYIPSPTVHKTATSDTTQQFWACTPITIDFQLTQTMKAPINMYYQLQSYYQNYRRYANSFDPVQLSGQNVPASSLSACTPLLGPGQLGTNLLGPSTVTLAGTQQSVNLLGAIYNPCGLVPWSKFNDTVEIYSLNSSGATTLICQSGNYDAEGTSLDPTGFCQRSGIAWPTDIGVKYTAPAQAEGVALTSIGWPIDAAELEGANYSTFPLYADRGWYLGEAGHKVPDPTDEDLMVWMRLALINNFQKLYRVITVDLPPGSYTMVIHQRYDTTAFGGSKAFVLSTQTWLGGPNLWLAGLYIGVGALCVVLAVAFFVKHLHSPTIIVW